MAIAKDDEILVFVDSLVRERTGRSLSSLQCIILGEIWRETKRTYKDIAQEYSYSDRYLKQVAGPALWKLLSDVFEQKVTKANLNAILQTQYSAYLASQRVSVAPYSSSTASQNRPSQRFIPGQAAIHLYKCLEGPLPLDSPFYIPRFDQEAHLCRQMLQSGAFLRIKAPRQIGKSSFLLRLLQIAKQQSFNTVTLNFKSIDQSILGDLKKLTRWTAASLSRQLSLPAQLDEFWDDDIGDKLSCTLYLEGHIIQALKFPLLIAFEEINELFDHREVAQEYLSMLRVWHENTRSDPSWKSINLVLVQSTESYIPLNVNQSPFTVGHELQLPAFTLEQVNALAAAYQANLDDSQLQQLNHYLNGHPQLLQMAFYALSKPEQTLESLLEFAPSDEGVFYRHLHRYLGLIESDIELKAALKQLLESNGKIQVPQKETFKLMSMGLVNLSGNDVAISCRLYQEYFSRRL